MTDLGHSSILIGSKSIINHLLPKHGPVLLSLSHEILGGANYLILRNICHVFPLGSRNLPSHGFCIRVIMLRYFMSSLFEYPIVLIVVVVTTLVHEIFEYFPHVVVIGPLLELQIPTILQIGVEFLWDASRQ